MIHFNMLHYDVVESDSLYVTLWNIGKWFTLYYIMI